MTAVSTDPPENATARVGFGAWWMLAVLFLFYFIAWIDRYSLTMMVEPIKADLGLSDFKMSLILGPAFAVFYGICGVPLGLAADRFDRRWVIFIGMIFWSLATVSSGFANTFMGLLLARMAIGVGEASLVPAAYSLLGDRFPKARLATAMAIFSMGQKTGMAASFTLAALAIAGAAYVHRLFPTLAVFEPWQMAFLMLGGPGIVFAFLVFTFREPPRRGVKADKSLSDKRLFGYLKENRRHTVPLALAVASVAICSNGLSAWAPAYIGRHFGWEPIQFGPAISLISLLSAFAVVAKGGIMDWLYARGIKDAHLRFYSWLLMCGVPVAAVAFLLPNPWMFIAALGFLQVIVLPYMVYIAATIQLMAPSQVRGGMTGLYFGISALVGAGFGPMIIGAVTDFVFRDPSKLGWSIGLVVTIGLSFTMVMMRVFLHGLSDKIKEREALDATF